MPADGYSLEKTLRPGEGHPVLCHTHAVLTLVTRGELRERFAAGRQDCAAWQLHYKPAGIPHATSSGPDGVRMSLVAVDRRALAELDVVPPDRPFVLDCPLRAARALVAIELWPVDRPRARRGIASALRRADAASGAASGTASGAAPPWLRRAHALARETDLGMRALAARCGRHPVYVARRFRRQFGLSIGELRRERRVARAVRRIGGGTDPLGVVALDLGYADQSHLTREFGAAIGVPPAAFRDLVAERFSA